MKNFFNVLIMSLIPTLCMCIIVSNMFDAQTEGAFMQFFTIFTFSFIITFTLHFLLLIIRKLEKRIKDIEEKLEKK